MSVEAARLNLTKALAEKDWTMVFTFVGELANEHMRRYDLQVKGWRFHFDHAKSRCGLCRYGRKRIQLSTYYIKSATVVDIEDTILHEMAHAYLGPEHGHDETWRQVAKQMGARPERCSKTSIQAPSRYIGKCSDCGFEFRRHRKINSFSLTFSTYRHTTCNRKPNKGTVVWYKNGKQLNFPEQRPVIRADGGRPAEAFAEAFAKAAQEVLGPSIKVSAPTQAEINELWARLDKLEGK